MGFWKYFCLLWLVLFVVCCCNRAYCFEGNSEVMLDLRSPQFSDLSDEQKMLISEFSTSYRSLVKFYENIRIDADLFAYSSTRNNAKYVFRAKEGNHYRMDVLNTDKPEEENESRIQFVTPDLFSTIRRSGSADEFYASEIRTENALEEGIGDFADYRFWLAPYSTEYFPMKYCVFLKPAFADYFKVSRLTQKNDGANDLVTIETQYFQKGNLSITGTFTFYRNLCWAVKETKWEYVSETEARYSFVEYSGEEKGVPLLSKVTYWYAGSNDETPVDQITKKDVYLCNVLTDPIPYSDFDVQQYVKIGLPNPNNYLMFRLFFAFLGIVLIAWGLWRHLKNKS